MRNFLKNWQGLWAFFALIALLCLSPRVIEKFWPTDAGIMPGSFIQALVFWQAVFFAGICGAWLAFQFDWHEIDKKLDAGEFLTWFSYLTPGRKIVVSLSLFFCLLSWQALSLWLVVSLLK